MNLNLLEEHKIFDGFLKRYKHFSEVNNCEMTFSIYIPNLKDHSKLPSIYWLSGLTCTDENFITKAGAFKYASDYGLSVIVPDTSPRGKEVPDDENYDLGQGAGFYLNATQSPWVKNYQMYDYITVELSSLIEKNFPVSEKKSIFGHSMGGHGALMIGLRNAATFQSISAFAPIVNPCGTNWGVKAFNNYLGDDQKKWKNYDSFFCLETAVRNIPILIHQGDSDNFYPQELQPEIFVEKAQKLGYPIEFYLVKGYDHSYYFISTFIEEHIKFHSRFLK